MRKLRITQQVGNQVRIQTCIFFNSSAHFANSQFLNEEKNNKTVRKIQLNLKKGGGCFIITTLLVENQAIEWLIGKQPVSPRHLHCVSKSSIYLFIQCAFLKHTITQSHAKFSCKMMKNKIRKIFPTMWTMQIYNSS